MDGCRDVRMNGPVDEWKDAGVDGVTEGWTHEWVGKWMDTGMGT